MGLRRISLLALIVFSLPACSEKAPFSQEGFVDFYVQLQLVDVQYGKQPAVQKEKVDSLMHAYSLNDSLVNSMISWYGKKPERWEKFVSQVERRVAEMRKQYIKPQSR